MSSVNKVILVGNLGRDPETRYSANGAAICNISLATTYKSRSQSGESRDETEWHRVVMFNRVAEVAGQYLRKGSSVYIEGRLRTNKWKDKEGQDRYTTEIIADTMTMLGGRGDSGGGGGDYNNPPADDYNQTAAPQRPTPPPQQPTPPSAPANQQNYQAQQSSMDDMGDDIPF